MLRTAATTDDLSFTRAAKGGLVCYDRLAAVNVGHQATLITFGFHKGANEILLESFAPAAANLVVATSQRVFVAAEWIPFARFSGGTTGDELKFYGYGYLTPIIET
jgi:hypothetical protein